MEPEKNLQASVPPALLTRAREVAQKEHVSLDEWLKEAMESSLNRQELEELLSFGKRHAKARGLKQGDVAKAIAEVRAEHTQGNY